MLLYVLFISSLPLQLQCKKLAIPLSPSLFLLSPTFFPLFLSTPPFPLAVCLSSSALLIFISSKSFLELLPFAQELRAQVASLFLALAFPLSTPLSLSPLSENPIPATNWIAGNINRNHKRDDVQIIFHFLEMEISLNEGEKECGEGKGGEKCRGCP